MDSMVIAGVLLHVYVSMSDCINSLTTDSVCLSDSVT